MWLVNSLWVSVHNRSFTREIERDSLISDLGFLRRQHDRHVGLALAHNLPLRDDRTQLPTAVAVPPQPGL
jgi:hypothetical protein